MNQGEASTDIIRLGLMATIYSVCLMRSEENALLYHCTEEDTEEVGDVVELSFMELQYGFEAIAVQLYYRFGVRAHHKVLVACEGHAAAELLACTACIRLGAPFVPLPPLKSDSSSSGGDMDMWAAIIADTAPFAAIITVTADMTSSEEVGVSAIARALQTRGVHRLLMLLPDGSLTPAHSSWTTSLPDITSISMPPYRSESDDERRPHSAAGTPVTATAIEDDEKEDHGETPPLYVLFTSGSSNGGEGKGVLGTQRGLLNRLAWQYRRFPFRFAGRSVWAPESEDESEDKGEGEEEAGGSVVCRRTPLTFVDAVVEMFGPLLGGVSSYAPPTCVLRRGDVLQLAELASRHSATRCSLLPSQLDLLCALLRVRGGGACWPSLQWVFVSGEECTGRVVEGFYSMHSGVGRGSRRLLGSPSARLVNLYGSTEVAGDVCCAELTRNSARWKSMPIGVEIIPGNVFYVARRRERRRHPGFVFQLVADGMEGELLVGGEQLCAGYTGAGAIAASGKFVCNPFRAKGNAWVCLTGGDEHQDPQKNREAPPTLYCTGDVVCVIKRKGVARLHFLRRNDDSDSQQTVFKIRGGVNVCVAQKERALQGALLALAGSPPAPPLSSLSSWNNSVPNTAAQQRQEQVVVAVVSLAQTNVLAACVRTDLLKSIWVECRSGGILTPHENAALACNGEKNSKMVSLYDFISNIPMSDVEEWYKDRVGDACFLPSQIGALTAALRQALLLRSSITTAASQEVALFFPVESFSQTSVPGKYNRHNFRKQMQMWVDLLSQFQHFKKAQAEAPGHPELEENDAQQRGGLKKRKWLSETDGYAECSGEGGESGGRSYQSTAQFQSCRQQIIDIILKVLPLVDQTTLDAATSSCSLSSFSFFALGGDSMSAVELIWMVKRVCLGISSTNSSLEDDAIRDCLSKPLHQLVDCVFRQVHDIGEALKDGTITDTGSGSSNIGSGSSSPLKYAATLPIVHRQDSDKKAEQACHWFGKAGGGSARNDQILLAHAPWLYAGAEQNCCALSRKGTFCSQLKLSKLWRSAFSKCIDGSPLIVAPSCPRFLPSLGSDMRRDSVRSRHDMPLNMTDMREGRLFIGSHNGEVSCVNTLTGQRVWQRFLGMQHHIEGAMAFDSSLVCQPDPPLRLAGTVSTAGLVFAASYWAQDVDGAEKDPRGGGGGGGEGERPGGRVWALCAASGDLLWHSGGLIAGEVKGSPIVLHLPTPPSTLSHTGSAETRPVSVLCVGSHDGCLYAFDARTGVLLKQLDLQKGALFASPVHYCCMDLTGATVEQGGDTRLLLVTTGGWVVSVALELTVAAPAAASSTLAIDYEVCLTVVWSRSTDNFAPIFATPVVVNCSPSSPHSLIATSKGGIYCVCCTVGGECLCLETGSGKVLWSLDLTATTIPCTPHTLPPSRPHKTSPVFSSPCAFPLLRKLSPECTNTETGEEDAGPVIRDVGVAFGCHDGILRFVSVQLGRVLWAVDLQGAIFASPTLVTVTSAVTRGGDRSRGNDQNTLLAGEEESGGGGLGDCNLAFAATTAGTMFVLSVPNIYIERGCRNCHYCGPDSNNNSNNNNKSRKMSKKEMEEKANAVFVLDRVSLPGEVYSSPVAVTNMVGTHKEEGTALDATTFVTIGCRDDSVYAFQLN